MAFVRRTSGGNWGVYQGNGGSPLAYFQSESDARSMMRRLHRRHDPDQRNRGKRACKRHFDTGC